MVFLLQFIVFEDGFTVFSKWEFKSFDYVKIKETKIFLAEVVLSIAYTVYTNQSFYFVYFHLAHFLSANNI